MQLAVSVVAILALSRVIEPVYGSKEYLKFLAIIDVSAVSSARSLLDYLRLNTCVPWSVGPHQLSASRCVLVVCLLVDDEADLSAQGVGAFITVYIAYAVDRNEEGNLL